MSSDASGKESKMLRRELLRVWQIVNAAMGAWSEQAAVFIEEIRRLGAELAELGDYCKRLEAEIRDLKRRLAVHENHNNPDRNTATAKKRKSHRRKVREKKAAGAVVAAGAEGDDPEGGGGAEGGLRKKGGQPGRKGISCMIKPDRGLDAWYAALACAVCGRTDLVYLCPIWKQVIEMRECGGRLSYMEVSVPALCLPCGIIIHPETPTIPGSACGSLMREKMMNVHKVAPSVRNIQTLLDSNHKSKLGTGTISHCMGAISKHAAEGRLWVRAPDDMVEAARAAYGMAAENVVAAAAAGPAGMEAHSEPPVELSAARQPAPRPPEPKTDDSPPAETLPVACVQPYTRRQDGSPEPLLCWIVELLSMAPHVMEDESSERVAGNRVQALTLLAPGIGAFIRIVDDKSKDAMAYMFQEILGTPLQADMYLAGNAFLGDIQTCRVHVWRKGESLAVVCGIDSPEQTYSEMHLEIYMQANDAAARITDAAGGPLTSLPEVAGVIRAVPGLEEVVAQETERLIDKMRKLIAAYEHGEVSDEEMRRYATTLKNALPFMFAFLRYPGMRGHTNEIERFIRRYVVLPRKIRGGLPDWTAAKTQANLQTLHANAEIWKVFPGQIVSGDRGTWGPPATKIDMIMSPPPQRPRPRITPDKITRTADPSIQAAPPDGQIVKAATA